jgi:hypothetical protein
MRFAMGGLLPYLQVVGACNILTCCRFDTLADETSAPNVAVIIRLSLRVRLFAGREWSAPPVHSAEASHSAEETPATGPIPPSSSSASASYGKSAMKSSGGGSGSGGGKRSVLFKDDGAGSGHRKNYRKNIAQHLPPTHPASTPSVAAGKRSGGHGHKQIGSGDGTHVGRDTADATEISLKSIVVHCRLYPGQPVHDEGIGGRGRAGHTSSAQVHLFLYYIS